MRVTDDVLTVLDHAETEGAALRLVGQLDRSLYVQTNKVLEAAGGKWNRKAKAHLFEGDAADAIEQILLTGEITVPQDFGFFETPPAVVARLMETADVPDGSVSLEPSAGKGAIAVPLSEVSGSLDAIELLPKNAAELRARLNGSGMVYEMDFLSTTHDPVYDRIVMNPPFARQADIHHVMHAVKSLRPGGRLVSVMSAGVTFRDNRLTNDLRQLVADRGGKIEPLPPGSFKASGTLVNACIVSMEAA
jgi:protein-L-isoaspartate O-methyltransferase